MTRRRYLLSLFALAACTTKGPSFEEVLPASAGAWTRQSIQPLTSYPAIVEQQGVELAATAVYTGPAQATVNIYRMRAQTSAFELIQKWRQTEGLAIYGGPYFVVAQPATPEVRGLLSELQKQLK